MAKSKKKKGTGVLAENRRARHEYEILERFEAGIELKGTEVKSLRQGRATLSEAYIRPINGELFIVGWYIAPYEQGNQFNRDPMRNRRLLLHRREIDYLDRQSTEAGLTLVPLKLYTKRGLMKLEIAVARGKKLYDKRQAIQDREQARQIDRHLKDFNRRAGL